MVICNAYYFNFTSKLIIISSPIFLSSSLRSTTISQLQLNVLWIKDTFISVTSWKIPVLIHTQHKLLQESHTHQLLRRITKQSNVSKVNVGNVAEKRMDAIPWISTSLSISSGFCSTQSLKAFCCCSTAVRQRLDLIKHLVENTNTIMDIKVHFKQRGASRVRKYFEDVLYSFSLVKPIFC